MQGSGLQLLSSSTSATHLDQGYLPPMDLFLQDEEVAILEKYLQVSFFLGLVRVNDGDGSKLACRFLLLPSARSWVKASLRNIERGWGSG